MRRYPVLLTLVALCCLTAASEDLFAPPAPATLTLSLDANHLNVLRNGTVGVTATVGNSGTNSMDWSVSNNGIPELTLSGSGSGLSASWEDVVGTFSSASYGTVDISAYAVGTDTVLSQAADGSPATSNELTMNVGIGTAALSGYDNLDAFEPANAMYAEVPAGGSYAGLSAMLLPVPREGPAPVSPDGRTFDSNLLVLGTEFTLLGGTNATGSAQTISMNFRTRAEVENFESMASPPVIWDEYGLISDVMELEGLGDSTFVLQVSYDPNEIMQELGRDEIWYAEHGFVYVGWLDPGSGYWINAVRGNDGGIFVDAGDNRTNGLTLGAYDGNMVLGRWGVDTVNNVVWAVLNHNSQFSGVPEPGTTAIVIAGLSMVVMFRRGRRRRRIA